MNYLIRSIVVLLMMGVMTFGASVVPPVMPKPFDSSQFETNGGRIQIKSGASITNLLSVGTNTVNTIVATNALQAYGSYAGSLQLMDADSSNPQYWVWVANTNMGTNAIVQLPANPRSGLFKFTLSNGTNLSAEIWQPESYSSYAAGTVYTLTDTMAKVDLGTTDPGLTVATNGTYMINASVQIKFNAATFAANQTLTLKLRRTNNTAADLTASTIIMDLPIITTTTDGRMYSLPSIVYTTSNNDDAIEIQAQLSAAPSSGSVSVEPAVTWIVARRIY